MTLAFFLLRPLAVAFVVQMPSVMPQDLVAWHKWSKQPYKVVFLLSMPFFVCWELYLHIGEKHNSFKKSSKILWKLRNHNMHKNLSFRAKCVSQRNIDFHVRYLWPYGLFTNDVIFFRRGLDPPSHYGPF